MKVLNDLPGSLMLFFEKTFSNISSLHMCASLIYKSSYLDGCKSAAAPIIVICHVLRGFIELCSESRL